MDSNPYKRCASLWAIHLGFTALVTPTSKTEMGFYVAAPSGCPFAMFDHPGFHIVAMRATESSEPCGLLLPPGWSKRPVTCMNTISTREIRPTLVGF